MYIKYKDRSPEQTVKMARSILSQWGVIIKEEWHDSEVDLHSVTLHIEGTDFFTNGKGTDKAYTLASAYGEMMERIQNLSFFRLNGTSALRDDNDYGNDDTLLNPSEDTFEQHINTWLKKNTGTSNCSSLIKPMYDFCKIMNQQIRYCRFKNYKNNKDELLIPMPIIDLYYGTNGMVAGNTSSEALVQGISELLERYVIRRLFAESITPPDITDEIVASMPEAGKWIESIESTDTFHIELKDLSLAKGIPAIGLILYNTADKSYFCKVGVHPVIEIAVERCFTELMQGQSISHFTGMTDASVLYTTNTISNLASIFADGTGAYPLSFFAGKPTYSKQLSLVHFENNNEMLESLITLINQLGYDLYIHNSTKTAFPAYHIIIPGLSELFPVTDSTIIQNAVEFEKCCIIIEEKITCLTEKDVDSILHLLTTKHIPPDYQLSFFLRNIRISGDEQPYTMVSVSLFLCMLYLYKKDTIQAEKWMHAYCQTLDKEEENCCYYFCYELMLHLKNQNADNATIYNYLAKFYDEDIVQMVFEDFRNNPFEALPAIECQNVCNETCELYPYCITRTEKEIYRNIRSTVLNP